MKKGGDDGKEEAYGKRKGKVGKGYPIS